MWRKYPRTPHLEGSRRQPGDEDLDEVPFRAIAGRHLVVEEKLDGANAGISFDAADALKLSHAAISCPVGLVSGSSRR